MSVWVLKLFRKKGLLDGKTMDVEMDVDSRTLEASAAMKGIVRRDTREGWRTNLTGLIWEAGASGPDEKPTVEEVKGFERSRQGKTVSNADWESPSGPDSSFARMKDGTRQVGPGNRGGQRALQHQRHGAQSGEADARPGRGGDSEGLAEG